jgi:hypothetical protein
MFHLAQYRKQGITVVDIDTDQVLDPVELQVVNS